MPAAVRLLLIFSPQKRRDGAEETQSRGRERKEISLPNFLRAPLRDLCASAVKIGRCYWQTAINQESHK